MKFLLPVVVIISCIAGSQCNWLTPPAGPVEWGLPNDINITTDFDDVHIYMLENTGNNWGPEDDAFFPVCEFLVEDTTEKVGFNSVTGSYEFREIGGRFVWFARKNFDAERETLYVSDLRTEPDRANRGFTIHIIDYNDEVPTWEDGDWSDYSQHFLETEEWGDEGDMESTSKRTIYEMTFSDKDQILTQFTAEIDNPECRTDRPKEVCDEILSLVEVDIPYPIVGRAIVRRAKGKLIDREARDLFVGDSNELNFLITIYDTDRTNSITSNFTMIVDDRNDNAPEFLTAGGLLVEVNEDDIVANKPFGQIKLRDLDDPNTPNGNFTVSIKAIKKEPSLPDDPELNTLFGIGHLVGSGPGNEFEVDVIPKIRFSGLAATYTIILEAKDGDSSEPEQLVSEREFTIIVEEGSTTDDGSSTTESGSSTTDEGSSTTEDTSSTTEDASSTTEDASSTTEDASSTTEDASSTTEDASSTTEDASSTTEDASSTTEDVSSTTEDASSTTEDASSTTEDVSSTTEDASSTTEDASSTTEDASSTTEDASSTTEDASSTTEDTSSTTDDGSSPPGGSDDDDNNSAFSLIACKPIWSIIVAMLVLIN